MLINSRTLKRPGWKRDWHIGIRESKSRKLLACIFAIPGVLRIRDKSIKAAEVSFLCIHTKFRCRRLAPALIKELSRRCSRDGVYQALYATETFLPTPISTGQYLFRVLSQEFSKIESSYRFSPFTFSTTIHWPLLVALVPFLMYQLYLPRLRSTYN